MTLAVAMDKHGVVRMAHDTSYTPVSGQVLKHITWYGDSKNSSPVTSSIKIADDDGDILWSHVWATGDELWTGDTVRIELPSKIFYTDGNVVTGICLYFEQRKTI